MMISDLIMKSHARPEALMLAVFSSTELVGRRFHPQATHNNAQGTHETGARNISLGLLWAVGEETLKGGQSQSET
jgi:hypothetical protein